MLFHTNGRRGVTCTGEQIESIIENNKRNVVGTALRTNYIIINTLTCRYRNVMSL